MAIQLNHVLDNSSLNLLKYQTRDGAVDPNVLNLWSGEFDPDADVNLFIDDIYCTGISSQACLNYIQETFPGNGLWLNHYFLVSRDEDVPAWLYEEATDDEVWLVMPWEI